MTFTCVVTDVSGYLRMSSFKRILTEGNQLGSDTVSIPPAVKTTQGESLVDFSAFGAETRHSMTNLQHLSKIYR